MKKIFAVLCLLISFLLFLYLNSDSYLMKYGDYDDYKKAVTNICRRGVAPIIDNFINLANSEGLLFKDDLITAIVLSGYEQEFKGVKLNFDNSKTNYLFKSDMISDLLLLPDSVGEDLLVSLFEEKYLSSVLKKPDLIFAISKLKIAETLDFFMKFIDVSRVKIQPESLNDRLVDKLDKSTPKKLLHLLDKETHSATRLRIIKALGEIGNSAVIEPFMELLGRQVLRDKEKYFIFEALQNISHKNREVNFIRYLQDYKDVINVIALFGFLKDKNALDSLIDIYNDTSSDKKVRRAAAIALAQIGDKNILEEFFFLLKNNQIDHWMINGDVRQLARIKDERLFELLVVILKERLLADWAGKDVLYAGKIKSYKEQSQRQKLNYKKRIVLNIIEALTILGDARTGVLFNDILLDKDIKSIDVRICLASGLYQLGDDKGLEYLISFIEKGKLIDTAYKYQTIIDLLGEKVGKREGEVLVDLFTKGYTSRQAREYIVDILLNTDVAFDTQSIVDMIINEKINLDFIDPATILLSDIGDVKVARAMLQMLIPERIEHIGYAISTIVANTGDESLVEPLLEIIENKKNESSRIEKYICVVSLMILGELGDASCIDKLIKFSNAEIHELSNVAVLSLGRLADKAAIQPLVQNIKQNLKTDGCKRDIDFLKRMLKDENVSILTKRYIVKTLAELEFCVDSAVDNFVDN